VKQVNWMRVLTVMLVILAGYAILFVTATILYRFTQAILLFVTGAMVAYILSPLVNWLGVVLRTRWLAILVSYVLLATGLLALAFFLFTPFIQQSQSFVDNLRNPSSASLGTITVLERHANATYADLKGFGPSVRTTRSLSPQDVQQLQNDVFRLDTDLTNVRNGTLSGAKKTQRYKRAPAGATRLPPNPPPQTQVPTSYINPLETDEANLISAFDSATSDPTRISVGEWQVAVNKAHTLSNGSHHMYHVMSTTPIALIRSQTWLDDHGIKINVQEKFGQAASQFSNQGTNVLNNVITILTETANLLLNLALILIIAFYFLLDSNRIIHGGVRLIPSRHREQAWFFISSLDRVLGGYIRGQLFLAALAGLLGGAGAAALGVPYPLLIGIITFMLQLIPVIGPMVALVPATLISLFFTPPLTTAALVVWFVIYQQIVTNVIGPHVNGMSVGIHPLEALLAVLVGYPLGGFLGAFLAVPVAGIVHIVIREFYGYFAYGHKLPTAEVPAESGVDATEPPQRPTVLKGPEGGRAVGS
jgi:predicted PurR-regulated permease PerM